MSQSLLSAHQEFCASLRRFRTAAKATSSSRDVSRVDSLLLDASLLASEALHLALRQAPPVVPVQMTLDFEDACND
ncbi:hypothetical protein nbrc107696_42640 [Gordonia spumicola]|uniref:Uncharacterized protein n=1 Tax=Gordonia spumicola TaxID=589161 RepID=A0A7I9VEN3_9ACTN|nr:hypothetical protein nbrc107696_42640 [Gordonia spumicola]